MKKHYSFAGVEVSVEIPEGWAYEDERQLAPFREDQVTDPHVFHFRPVDSLSAPNANFEVLIPGMRVYRSGENYVRYIGTVDSGWENAYIRAEYGEKEHFVQVKIREPITRIGVKTVLNALAAEHLVAESGGFIFHCAYIDYHGKAILFTAPSGTGKSTQAELWRVHRGAEIINGDRAAVCVKDGTLVAAGIPFAGSSIYCLNRTLPIAAIVYLCQAPKTSIRKLRGVEAFSRIWEGVSVNTWVKEDVERVADAVRQAATEIPIYYLPCTPDESAVVTLEEALRKQEVV